MFMLLGTLSQHLPYLDFIRLEAYRLLTLYSHLFHFFILIYFQWIIYRNYLWEELCLRTMNYRSLLINYLDLFLWNFEVIQSSFTCLKSFSSLHLIYLKFWNLQTWTNRCYYWFLYRMIRLRNLLVLWLIILIFQSKVDPCINFVCYLIVNWNWFHLRYLFMFVGLD